MRSVVAVLVWIHAVVAFPVQDESNFYVEDVSGNQNCRLATPHIINYTGDYFYVDLPGIQTQHLDVLHRVGYVKTLAVFDYVGCTQFPDGTDIKPNITGVPPDIGKCYSFCNCYTDTVYFGISNDNCYCFDSNPPFDHAWCGGILCNDNETVCGGADGYTSLYKLVTVDDTLDDVSQSDGKNCRLYNGAAGRAVWEKCSTPHSGLCSDNDTGVLKRVNDSAPWPTYTGKCFQQDSYPATVGSGENKQVDVWLGQIKTDIIQKEYAGRRQHSFEEGFVYNDGQGLRLSFSTVKRKASKRLCVKEHALSTSTTEVPTTTATTTTTTSTAAATTASLAYEGIAKNTSGFTTQSTDKATIESASDARSESARFMRSTYFYIAVGGSALILVGVVVICCCCCTRRKRRKANVHNESKHSSKKQDQTPGGGDVTYDVCDIPATSGSSGAPRDTDYDTAATLATHRGRSPARGDDDSSNVYNTTQDFSNDIYDHAGASKDKPAVFGDNIYNTMATEDLYDHTSSDKTEQDLI